MKDATVSGTLQAGAAVLQVSARADDYEAARAAFERAADALRAAFAPAPPAPAPEPPPPPAPAPAPESPPAPAPAPAPEPPPAPSAWRPRILAQLQGSARIPVMPKTAQALDRLARFDVISSSCSAGEVQAFIASVAAIRERRAQLGLPPQRFGVYVNTMETYAYRVNSMTRTGSVLRLLLDDLNGAEGNPLKVGVGVQIYGSEEPAFDFDRVGALRVTAIGGSVGAYWADCTLPAADGQNVTNSRAVCLRSDFDRFAIERAAKASREGWFVADWDDPQTPGDWGVWGLQYRTLDLNLTDWAPADANGERYPEWYARRECELRLQALHDAGALDFVFTDNTWSAPSVHWGERNGWGDWMRTGTNQNAHAATAEGRLIRQKYREGHRRFIDTLRARLPGLGWYANVLEAGTEQVTVNHLQFRGSIDMAMRESLIPSNVDTASKWATQIRHSNTVRGALATPAGLSLNLNTSAPPTDAELLRGLAFFAMLHERGEAAGTLCVGPADRAAWAFGGEPFPALLDLPWGEPIDPPRTAPGQGGNGVTQNEADTWCREFERVVLAANASETAPRRVYPRCAPDGSPIWKDRATGVAVGLDGLTLPPLGAAMLLPV